MKLSLNKDKNLSGMLILFTLGFILYSAGSNEGLGINSPMTIKDTISHIIQFYLDAVIISFIFICFVTMYKTKLIQNGGSKMGMKFFVLFSAALFLFISGYTSYYSILMYFMSKEDCLCVNKWQKYIIYIQGAFNSIYFLRLLFLFVFIALLLSFNMK